MDPILGSITIFGSFFAPVNYSLCFGQLLSIPGNTALFSILGTYYGGNGTSNFALPDLRGRVPVGYGQGPGLSNYDFAMSGGVENVNLTQAQMPIHTHIMAAANSPGTSAAPGNSTFISAGPITGSGPNASALKTFTSDSTNLVSLNPQAIAASGSSQTHTNMQPYLCMSYIIAMQGVYPSRN